MTVIQAKGTQSCWSFYNRMKIFGNFQSRLGKLGLVARSFMPTLCVDYSCFFLNCPSRKLLSHHPVKVTYVSRLISRQLLLLSGGVWLIHLSTLSAMENSDSSHGKTNEIGRAS